MYISLNIYLNYTNCRYQNIKTAFIKNKRFKYFNSKKYLKNNNNAFFT